MSSNESFEKLARCAMAQAIAYRARRDTLPPRPLISPQELRSLFDTGLPERGLEGVEVLETLAAAAEHGLVGTTAPNFFAWVMGASHPVGVAAEWMVTAWGQNAGIYDTAPAAAVAEDVASGWLLELLDLPRDSSIGFTTGATMASTICLAVARSEVLRRLGFDLEREGLFTAPAIKVFLGEEAHSTIFSGLRFLGFGENDLVKIPADERGRMLSTALEAALSEFEGPSIVVCQAGHINSGDFDPIASITAIAKAHGAWCHVDGAFGLWARAVPHLRQLCAGVEHADSWTVDGHKWLQVPYDSGFAIVRDGEAHRRAMHMSASYLSIGPGDARSPSAYCPELSRRARGFAVWAVIQALGRSGIQEMIARHCRCALHLRDLLAPEPGISVLNEVVLNQLALAFDAGGGAEEGDQLTARVIAEMARENACFVEGARWHGRKILRISITSQRTDIDDIEALGTAILHAWQRVQEQENTTPMDPAAK